MSQEAPKDLGTSTQNNEEMPDSFSLYNSQITELLSLDILLHSAPQPSKSNSSTLQEKAAPNSLFGNLFGNGFTDFKKSRLQLLLRQSVFSLSQEVDQMLYPVHSVHRIRRYLQYRKDLQSNLADAASQDDAGNCQNKRLKKSSLPSSISKASNCTPKNCVVSKEDSVRDGKIADLSEPGKSNDLGKKCSHCHIMETSKMSSDSEKSLKSFCSTCEHKKAAVEDEHNKDHPVLEPDAQDDLSFFIEKDPTNVEATVSKHSDILSETLLSMGKKLEGLLDMVFSCCRKMTINEKQQLQKLIQKLPSRNFNHIVGIIRYKKQPPPCRRNDQSDDNDMNIDLEKQDDKTLWRLYYYVKAVENAKKISLQTPAK